MTKSINTISIIRISLFITIMIILMTISFNLPRVMIPMIISYILSLIIQPVLHKLKFLRINNTILITLLTLLCLFLVFLPIIKTIPMIKLESENLQYYIPKIETYLRESYFNLTSTLEKKFGLSISTTHIDDFINLVKTSGKNVLLEIPTYLAKIFEWTIVVPFFLFFFLRDKRVFIQTFLSFVPNILLERTYILTHQFNKKLGDYIFAKFIEASIIGIITVTGLFILEIRFAISLGILAFITNIVPYIGPFLGAIPGIIICLIEHGPGPTLWAVILLYLFANLVDLAFIFPILVSKIVDIHPIIVVLSVLIGSQWGGILGMIISIPMAVIIKLLLFEIFREISGDIPSRKISN